LNMRIIKVANDIFNFAPEHCDGVAFWLTSGFSTLRAGWIHNFLPRCEAAGFRFLRYRNQDGTWWGAEIPFTPPEEGGFYQIRLSLGSLRFIYIHPNPGNLLGVLPEDVPLMVRESLDALEQAGCHFIAMNGIHGLNEEGDHWPGGDLANNEQTMTAIRQWRDEGERHIQRLYLVDLKGGFGPAEPDTDATVTALETVEGFKGYGRFPDVESWQELRAFPELLGELQHHPIGTVLGVLEEYRLGYYETGRPYKVDSPFYLLGRQDADAGLAFGTSLNGTVPPRFLGPWGDL
jgi:hypothetical protein